MNNLTSGCGAGDTKLLKLLFWHAAPTAEQKSMLETTECREHVSFDGRFVAFVHSLQIGSSLDDFDQDFDSKSSSVSEEVCFERGVADKNFWTPV